MKKIIRISLGVIAVLILINSLYLWLTSSFTLGIVLTTILGTLLLLLAIIPNVISIMLQNKLGRIIKFLILLMVLFFAFFSSLITFSGQNDSVTYKEDAIIVLGAGIRGEAVTPILEKRLQTALQYHQINPNALLVVSGGMGDGENITEAEAMARYLKLRGVPEDKILLEKKATSTSENFRFSKELLDKRFNTPYTTGYITNHFHIFRASRIANSVGIHATHLHAENVLLTLLPNYLRECCAIAAQWFTW